ncbi:MAG: hypothetical protein N2053_10075 [Chitinispirillaceae bacterium]|nr:hypothetical protein [Chitinispirillaceae bacterium]
MKLKNIIQSMVISVLFFTSISYSQWWTKLYAFKSSTVAINATKTDSEGNIFLAGYYFDCLIIDETLLRSQGREDCFIIKIDTAGKLLSALTFGGSGIDRIFDITIKKDGDFVATGIFQKEMQIDDTLIAAPVNESFFVAEFAKDNTLRWVKISSAGEGISVCTNENGDVAVTGIIRGEASFTEGDTIRSLGDQDIFLVYYDKHGNTKWIKRIGANIFETPSRLSFWGNDKIYLAGNFVDTFIVDSDTIISNSSYDQSFVSLFDTSGSLLKLFPVLSSGRVQIYSLVNDNNGNIFISGVFSSSLSIDTITIECEGESSMFIAAMTAEGKIKWIVQVQSASGNDIIFGADNDVYVCGSFKRSTKFGNYEVTSKSVEDVFVASYSLDGEWKWLIRAGGCRSSTATRITFSAPLFFVSGITEVNLETAICHIEFGSNRIATTYYLDDRGRAFLAVGNYLLDSTTAVLNPLKKGRDIFSSTKKIIRAYDLRGRIVRDKILKDDIRKRSPSVIITETSDKKYYRYLLLK